MHEETELNHDRHVRIVVGVSVDIRKEPLLKST
jgi:hypothetical protein